MKKRYFKFFSLAVIVFFVVLFGAHDAWADVTVPSAASGLPTSSDGIKGILENLVKWALGIFGLLAIISFVVSGIQYLTAAGDDDQAKKAKKNMTYSIIGVVIGLAGYIIIKAIETALKGSSNI